MIDWLFDELKNPYFAAFFAGMVTFGCMYVDSKITRKELTRKEYTKNILMVMIIVGTIVYILQSYSLNPKIKNVGGAPSSGTGKSTAHVMNYDSSDIFVGDPNF